MAQKKAVKKKAARKKTVSKKTPPKKVRMKKIEIGAPAPAFTVRDDQGRNVSLSDFSGKKVVLYFYPKDDTPGCTREACDFRDSMARLQSAGTVVLGVSKDSEGSHAKFKTKYSLNFPLLADVDGKLCEAYGVWQEKKNYGKTYMGIVRSTFLIDAKGNLAKVYSNVKVDGHAARVLEDLAGI
jgi:peroxiredoxin Q/BCP